METTKTSFSKAHLAVVAAIVVAVAAGSFYGGDKFAEAKRGAARGGNVAFGRGQLGAGGAAGAGAGGQGAPGAGGQGRGGAGARGAFGGGVAGQIIASDEKSITVKMPDGGTKIVFFGGDVKISKSQDGAVSDLKEGEQAMVIGTSNADGSVTAQSIRLGDQPFMMRTGGGANGGAPNGQGAQGGEGRPAPAPQP